MKKGIFLSLLSLFFRTVSGWTASYSEGKYYLSIKNESSVTVYIKMCHMTIKKIKNIFIYFEHSDDDCSKLTLADISQYYELFQSVLRGSLRNLSSLHDHLLPFQQSGMQQ